MTQIRNDSPLGELDVPLLRRLVGAGEVVEVTDDQARRLLQQEIWSAADDEAARIQAELDDTEGVTDDAAV